MIILDMDGVLANFNSAANRVHNLPDIQATEWNWYHKHGMTDEEFWKKIHLFGDEFYRDWVHPYPWCGEVMRLVREADDFVIMTAPSDHPAGYSGKKVWIERHLADVSPKQIIVGSQKQLLAKGCRLLIDDNVDNIRSFRNAGGNGFLFPQPWNNPDLVGDRMRLLELKLSNWKERMTV